MEISTEDVQKKVFNPNEHLMQIKTRDGNKDYLPVQWRLVWFRSVCPEGSIETEMLLLDLDKEFSEGAWDNGKKVMKTSAGIAVFKAVVKDGQGGVATGTKTEKGVSFPDFVEKAETGAIGRALAALGYGTQFTGDEWDEAHRIVDSPVEGQSSNEGTPDPLTLAKQGQEEMTALRARVLSIKPKGKQGVMNFEQFYGNVLKKPFKSDRETSVADRKRLNDQLDVIVRMRVPVEGHSSETAAS